MAKFYVTIAIPYVNGKPHIGHALEYFQADTVRRYHTMRGDETLILSGTDENALKNVQAAEKDGTPIQQYLDQNSQVFRDAFQKLGVNLDVFQRGSDQKTHWPGVQKLWELAEENGAIYKKSYEGLYCVGCESFKLEKELTEDGLCPIHLTKPEVVKEENYFLKLSDFQDRLVELIESDTLKITPDNKRLEALNFIKSGLDDFSISRSKERAKGVGVPVPGDPNQIIYVWFDALAIYMTGIGFGWDEAMWKKWWPADLHIIGKDINRFHTVYWPAMLLAAGLPLPKEVLIHSFINAPGGQKMSKSLGNVIDPFDMVEQFGLEPVRYYLLSQIPLAEDGEASIERFKEVYSADLANGLGNLISRIAKLAERSEFGITAPTVTLHQDYTAAIDAYRFPDALGFIWGEIRKLDKLINEQEPWKLEGEELKAFLTVAITKILEIAYHLRPFLPETAAKIEQQFSTQPIKSGEGLFPRL